MTDSAFSSAKEILANASHAQPCQITVNGDERDTCNGMFIPCDIDQSTATPLLQAAMSRVHPEAKLITVTNHPGVFVCFPPQYTTLPIQQIAMQLRALERDVADCIRRQDDGAYIIARDPKTHPLDLHELLDAIAGQYYRQEFHRLRQHGKPAEDIEKFDAAPYYLTPKGEVFVDEDGIRYTKLDGRQVREFVRHLKEQGKTTYEPAALLDHVTLGPVSAHEVFSRLGLLPPGERRFEIN